MLMKQYYQKKAQYEKRGNPYAVFKIKRKGTSKKFKKINKLYGGSLEVEKSYPIYYEFTQDDLPAIYEEVINSVEYGMTYNDGTTNWVMSRDSFFLDFELYHKRQLENGVDYEYDVTYETVPQEEERTYTFDHINELKNPDQEQAEEQEA